MLWSHSTSRDEEFWKVCSIVFSFNLYHFDISMATWDGILTISGTAEIQTNKLQDDKVIKVAFNSKTNADILTLPGATWNDWYFGEFQGPLRYDHVNPNALSQTCFSPVVVR